MPSLATGHEGGMVRTIGAMILMALMVTSVACSPGTAQNPDHIGEETRHQSGSREKTVAPETTSAGAPSGESNVGGGTEEVIDAVSSLDYVALGDSLAAGVGAHR